MKILVKFPSRERSSKFKRVLEEYIEMSSKKDISYLITLDKNCPEVNLYISHCEEFKKQGHDVKYVVDDSHSKIHAINRDMEKSGQWDILVLASDDMICQVQNWDLILRNEMESKFPDTDGVLWHWDGDRMTHINQNGLNTMCVLGRAYYYRFGYIYHPDYRSLFCDNEFTEVSKQLCKMYWSDKVLFKHVHFSNTPNLQPDALMKRTQSLFKEDEKLYFKRKSLNFGI